MTNEYPKGTILLVYQTSGDFPQVPSSGDIVRFISGYEGEVDLSYHGSPWYEKFILAENLETGETREYGDQDFSWVPLREYLRNVRDLKIALNTVLNSIEA